MNISDYNLSLVKPLYFNLVPNELIFPIKKYCDDLFINIATDAISSFHYGVPKNLFIMEAISIHLKMNNSNLKYHNYLHPLHIMSLCEENKINLTLEHFLFLIYHDCIYKKVDKDENSNEVQSSEIFVNLLYQRIRYKTKIAENVYTAILATEHHFKQEKFKESDVFCMDLDLLPLTETYDNFVRLSEMVIQEYVNLYKEKKSIVTKLRMEFLEKISSKDLIKVLPNKKLLNSKIKENIKRYINERQI